MEDDGVAAMQREVDLVEFRERHIPGARNALAGMLVGLPDVDERRAGIDEPLRFVGRDGAHGHGGHVRLPLLLGFAVLLAFAVAARGLQNRPCSTPNSSSMRGSAMRYQSV